MTESVIRIERSQRDPNKPPWWWILGDTYPQRVLLKQHGARFSGKRRAWYFVGWELPPPIRQLTGDVTQIESAPEETEEALDPDPGMSPELERQILDTLAQDDAEHVSNSPLAVVSQPEEKVEAEKPIEDEKPPAIRVTKPAPFPINGEPLTAVQAAIRDARSIPMPNTAPHVNAGQIKRIAQSYCGELTGSISGQVFSYGWAVHEGVCVYLNMAGPRVAVEAIRAKLSKGDQVSVVPPDAPAIELTAGEGNTGMYHAYLHYLPEARFASLILVHDWAVTPNYGGK
ncbi:MAG: hypothetical protein IAE80_22520, partial [Anaerolinea sp.]|nr:hypothetical protein [Anaerolinea sp.]